MERLTERAEQFVRIKGCRTVYPEVERKSAPMQSAVARLAAYEDTGLMPEEIKDIVEMFHAYRHICHGLDPDRVSELTQAEKDGRLVIQDVYALWPIDCDMCSKRGDGECCDGLSSELEGAKPGDEFPFMAKNCPKSVEQVKTTQERLQLARAGAADADGIRYFLTREEAEAALNQKEETE